MRRIRRATIGGMLATTAVLAGALAPTGTASTSSAPGLSNSVTDSRQLTGAPFLEGLVTGSEAAGAKVVVRAWPTDEKLSGYEVGDMIPVTTIANTSADRTGAYQLRIDPKVAYQSLASDEGLLDIEVTADSADGATWGSHSMTLDIGEKGADFATAADEPEYLRVTPDGEPANGAMTLDLALDHEAIGDPASQAVNSASSCPSIGTRLIQNLGQRNVVVGKVGASNGIAKAWFTYTNGSASTLGVGVSRVLNGTFSASGTSSTSSTVTIGFPVVTKKTRNMRTTFRYGKYCTTTRSPGPSFQYSVRANQFIGGAPGNPEVAHPATPASYCTTVTKGHTWTKSTTNARTYTGGAKLGTAIGINLSARTGYTTKAKVRFEILKKGRLCGTNGLPAASPGQLVARNP